jgi:hypothetical protein
VSSKAKLKAVSEALKGPTMPTVRELLGPTYSEEFEGAWPDIDPPYFPVGTRLLVQLRCSGAYQTLLGGKKLWVPEEYQHSQNVRTQTALVRAMGPACFRNRATGEAWIEGDWCVPGEFIRVPMYGGDRVSVPVGDEWKRNALFMAMNDSDVIGIIHGNPLAIKTIS